MSELCRICMRETDKPISIKRSVLIAPTKNSEKTLMIFCEIYNFCTNLEAKPNDELSQYFCNDCASQLMKCFQFLKTATESNKILRRVAERAIKCTEKKYRPQEEDSSSSIEDDPMKFVEVSHEETKSDSEGFKTCEYCNEYVAQNDYEIHISKHAAVVEEPSVSDSRDSSQQDSSDNTTPAIPSGALVRHHPVGSFDESIIRYEQEYNEQFPIYLKNIIKDSGYADITFLANCESFDNLMYNLEKFAREELPLIVSNFKILPGHRIKIAQLIKKCQEMKKRKRENHRVEPTNTSFVANAPPPDQSQLLQALAIPIKKWAKAYVSEHGLPINCETIDHMNIEITKCTNSICEAKLDCFLCNTSIKLSKYMTKPWITSNFYKHVRRHGPKPPPDTSFNMESSFDDQPPLQYFKQENSFY
uniref:ZAD domain-containing protein n=1 Tax=Megaselia scalaris TaxID=36166 RepID=T1GM99_MEGSC